MRTFIETLVGQARRGKDSIRQIGFGAGGAFAMKLLGTGAAYAFTAFVGRRYGADAWGNFALFFAIVSLFALVARMGTDSALPRLAALEDSKEAANPNPALVGRARRIVSGASLMLAAALFALSSFLASTVFDSPDLAPSLRLGALILWPFAMLEFQAGEFRARRRTAAFSFYRNASRYVIALAILVLTSSLGGDPSPVHAFGIAVLLATLLSAVHLAIVRGRRGRERPSTIKSADIVRCSLPMMLTASLSLIMMWTDTVCVGLFLGDAEVGTYDVASRVARLSSFTLDSVNSIVAPLVASAFAARAWLDLYRKIRWGSLIILLSSAPILGALALFPERILGLFGSDFADSGLVLLVLVAGQLVNVSCGSVGVILQMTGFQMLMQRIMIGAAIANLFLNLTLIPVAGALGAAIATSLTMIGWNVAATLAVRARIGIWTPTLLDRILPRPPAGGPPERGG